MDTVTSSRSKISEQDTGKYALLCSWSGILCPNADLCLLYSRSPGRFLSVAGQYRIRFRPQGNSVGNLGCGLVEGQQGRQTERRFIEDRTKGLAMKLLCFGRCRRSSVRFPQKYITSRVEQQQKCNLLCVKEM